MAPGELRAAPSSSSSTGWSASCRRRSRPGWRMKRSTSPLTRSDATCVCLGRYHLMAMPNDDSFVLDATRSGRRGHAFAERRGPIIDQEGREIPPETLGMGPRGFRFDFAHSSANPFGDLTREQRLARLDAL